jgi:Flp pilus assembly protein TadB
VKRLSRKDKEVLEACLSGESPSVKAKVYEIISVSELDPSDPMFLVLALTGQMRVLLEAGEADLNRLLSEWKSQASNSFEEIERAIDLVQRTQQQQADAVKHKLEAVSADCVRDIKEVGMAAVSAISEANRETLKQARDAVVEARRLKDEVLSARSAVDEDIKKQQEEFADLSDKIEVSKQGMERGSAQMHRAYVGIKNLQKNIVWLELANWFSPLTALLIAFLVGAGCGWWAMWLKYNDSVNVLGRNLVQWNLARVLKCQDDNNPKCTIWIVPEESRKK